MFAVRRLALPSLVVVAALAVGATPAAAATPAHALRIRVSTPKPLTPGPKGNGIAGRYFFRTELIGSTSYTYAVYFVDDAWAYRGVPEGGLPSCSARTAQGDGDGCVPYTLDPKSGALSVDGKAGKLDGAHQITVDEYAYAEVAIPTAGTRYASYGEYVNAYGFPPYGSYVAVNLKLAADGQFARSAAVSGSTPEGDFTALPADEHGSYEIQPAGRLHSVYADGHVEDDTIGVLYDDSGKPNPNYGLLLDDSIFFGPDSDVG